MIYELDLKSLNDAIKLSRKSLILYKKETKRLVKLKSSAIKKYLKLKEKMKIKELFEYEKYVRENISYMDFDQLGVEKLLKIIDYLRLENKKLLIK